MTMILQYYEMTMKLQHYDYELTVLNAYLAVIEPDIVEIQLALILVVGVCRVVYNIIFYW